MRVEHAKAESLVTELKHQVEEKKGQLGEASKKLERQQTVSREDKVCRWGEASKKLERQQTVSREDKVCRGIGKQKVGTATVSREDKVCRWGGGKQKTGTATDNVQRGQGM
jgi:predicted nuclease with TOPRIM domain